MIISSVDLHNWKTQKQIIYELHNCGININSRTWRNEVEKWNKRFYEGEVNYYISHSNKGFKATTEYVEAKMARDDYYKRAIDMLGKARDCDKAFKQFHNFKIDFETGEIV